MKKNVNVVGAIIENSKHEILCTLRPKNKSLGNMWEFPGGKLEEGESDEIALKREIKEELNIEIKVKGFYEKVSKEYESFIINLTCFKCKILDENNFKLIEHSGYVWLKRESLNSLIWVPTDIVIVEKLMGEKNRN